MNQTIEKLLNGNWENHMLPFFWQHGETEKTLREMMAAIQGANCGAVCIESRPHPDFCGPGWWKDMDVILDEARKRNMKVWILDDSHFPTGFANGAMLQAAPELCKKNIFCNYAELGEEAGTKHINLRKQGLMEAPKRENVSAMEAMYFNQPPARVFGNETDEILSITAVMENGTVIDLCGCLKGETVSFEKAKGKCRLEAVISSHNSGYHRDYINVTEKDSCRILIDTVYEAHYEHYADDFGNTIAGFFSDEPELGNGYLYYKENFLGCRQDLPWGRAIQERVAERMGEGWQTKLPLLWSEGKESETSRIRYIYMDELTQLVRDSFSYQIGDWCREHGVKYIGHLIEDDGQHCRTGSSLGHYFRGLEGQDMAGIDDIGGQVLPQGEEEPKTNSMRQPRNGEFYHYGLAKLAQSAAAIEPRKNGNAMCEIFGNYGWQEGVKLEKYLADHFLVRGINYFVPHAFSGKDFPDPDCPPHFFAHGHNPQYRHFGKLMNYMNRSATITSSGKHRVPAAILYHGEAQWCDNDAMPFEKPLHVLYDRQIDCHVLPADVFARPEFYHAELGCPFAVNGQEYKAVIVPGCSRIPRMAALGLAKLKAEGLPVIFAGRMPSAFCGEAGTIPEILSSCPVAALNQLAEAVCALNLQTPVLKPSDKRIRILQIQGDTPVFMVVNEGTEVYEGMIHIPKLDGEAYFYDAWFNCVEKAEVKREQDGLNISVRVEPLKSLFIVCGECKSSLCNPKACFGANGEEVTLKGWKRSICEGASYPKFHQAADVALPDTLAEEQPEFSGYVRYETQFLLERDTALKLVITDAQEGVEVFLNGVSAGIQIVPEYVYGLSGKRGNNVLVIEVATTLERQCYPMLEGYRKMLAALPAAGSGITGEIHLYQI